MTSAEAFEIAQAPSGASLHLASPLALTLVFDPEVEADRALSVALRRALDTWNAEGRGRFVLEWAGRDPELIADDARSRVERVPAFAARLGEGLASIVAFTVLTFDAQGTITEADVLLNVERFRFDDAPGAFDAESVLLHELGHALGLAHSCGAPGGAHPSCFDVADQPPGQRARILEAVMAPTLGAERRRRTLNADDREAVAALYAPSSTVARPRLDRLRRACPDGGLVLDGSALVPVRRVFLRRIEGAPREIPFQTLDAEHLVLDPGALEGALDGRGDLVAAVDSGVYGALVGVLAPPPCSPAAEAPAASVPTEAHTGCSHVTSPPCSRHERRVLATLGLMAFLFGLSSYACHRLRRVLWGSALVLGLGGAPEALAFKCSRVSADHGPSLFWTQRRIAWSVNAALSDDIADKDAALREVQASFQTWQDAECSDIELPFRAAVEGLRAGFDPNEVSVNAVVFVESNWIYEDGVIALTTNAYNPQSGVVVDSDIEMNGEEFRFVIADDSCAPRSGVMDLRNVLTHEVGHLLGLDHPPATVRNAESTMFASAPACETKKRSLAPDDVAGICAIYPSGAATVPCFPADGPSFIVVEEDDGFGCSAMGRASGGLSAIGLWIASLGLRRFLARRASGR